MCSVMGALTAAVIACTCHAILRRYTSNTQAASCLGGLFFGLCPLAWEHSIGAEVFALNNLLCSCIVFLVVVVLQSSCSPPSTSSHGALTRTHFLVVLGSLCCGFAAANQHTSALLLCVAIPTVLLSTHALYMSPAYLALIAAAFVLPMCSYFSLVLAALHPSPGSWGDASNLQGLLTHVLRAEYGTFKLGALVIDVISGLDEYHDLVQSDYVLTVTPPHSSPLVLNCECRHDSGSRIAPRTHLVVPSTHVIRDVWSRSPTRHCGCCACMRGVHRGTQGTCWETQRQQAEGPTGRSHHK